ncbi:MAG: Fe-S-binding domain-containing protein, partial [Chloroflexi bacterium]|nr:Fe-S-binding domain-containing protein [Chloroflexota bacterium]
LSLMLLIVALSSLGLPGLNGFVGEFLILLGTFRVSPFFAAIAATGVVLAAVYLLSMLRRVVFGPLENPANQNLPDASPREAAILLAILALIFFIGIYPQPILERMEPAVSNLVTEMQAAQGVDLALGE